MPKSEIPQDWPENAITAKIINCAIEVHRQLGPGLLEAVYEKAMLIEFDLRRIRYENQKALPVVYKGHLLGEYRLDLLVEDMVVVELKSTFGYDPVFAAQILNYMHLTQKRVGLLINFNRALVKDGITRFAL